MKNKVKKMSGFTRQLNGFTLFEMLVVISIIAILMATVTLSFSAAQKKARDAKRLQDIKSIQTAAEQYYSMSSYVYPAAAGAWTALNGQVVLSVWPKDPKGDTFSTYYYGGPAVFPNSYCICAKVEDHSYSNSGQNCGSFGSPSASDNYYCLVGQQ